MPDLHLTQAASVLAAQTNMGANEAIQFIRKNTDEQYVAQDNVDEMIRKARQTRRDNQILNQATQRDARSEQ